VFLPSDGFAIATGGSEDSTTVLLRDSDVFFDGFCRDLVDILDTCWEIETSL
jgi:hypothetical protein